jgi:inosine/xanthosine triphosphate pyrophosphatase family protein
VSEENGLIYAAPDTALIACSLFHPHGERQTVAQLGDEIKNKQSARYLALRKLARFLRTQK